MVVRIIYKTSFSFDRRTARLSVCRRRTVGRVEGAQTAVRRRRCRRALFFSFFAASPDSEPVLLPIPFHSPFFRRKRRRRRRRRAEGDSWKRRSPPPVTRRRATALVLCTQTVRLSFRRSRGCCFSPPSAHFSPFSPPRQSVCSCLPPLRASERERAGKRGKKDPPSSLSSSGEKQSREEGASRILSSSGADFPQAL